MAQQLLIKLDDRLADFADRVVAEGYYASVGDAIHAGLRLLEEHQGRVEAVRAALVSVRRAGRVRSSTSTTSWRNAGQPPDERPRSAVQKSHGQISSRPVVLKSAMLRVASCPQFTRAMAAIMPSAADIGAPCRSADPMISPKAIAASSVKPKILPAKRRRQSVSRCSRRTAR